MGRRLEKHHICILAISVLFGAAFVHSRAGAADKLIGLYSARVMSQSMPWIAQEAGLLKKYDLDFQFVFVVAGAPAVAAILTGDVEVTIQGGLGITRAFVQGNRDLAFIAGIKNILTHSLLAKPEIKKPENLKGKKIGVTRIGSNPHYLAVQALRHFGLDPARDVAFIQTGGTPEALAALVSGGVDAAVLTAPIDAQAIGLGFHYVVYGPDLRIPYAATTFNTRRSIIAKRPQVLGRFMRAMAEAAKILHTDREFTYKILGKYLRLDDRKILDAAYDSEIKVLEPRLVIKPEALQAILDEISPTEPRAKKVKAQELIDARYVEEMEKSGFFDRLWSGKR
ncbi:MAG: ABC transporter substrate-binding protein [Deltaproteobacteria bacterium]|nr:ABC transporter substrate-binding protein [Deltaproteobacteria bacterium]